jgi:hypothetical protein
MARSETSTPGWRPRELVLLVFPILAVLFAADEIGDRPSGDRASAWGWFLGVSAVAAVAGARYGARSSLRPVDRAARRLSTSLAITAALLGGAVFQLVGGLPRVVAMEVFSAFLLTTVIVRAYRALTAPTSRR